MAEQVGARTFFEHTGPRDDVEYPIRVVYCDVCDGWPLEYCEFHPDGDKAKEWAEKNLPDDMMEMYLTQQEQQIEQTEAGGDGQGEKKKRQTRGGKGVVKTKKKEQKEQKICLSRASRGKKKFVTVVAGIGTFDIDLKVASKAFANKFSCGSSVTGDDEIVIQGDVKDDLFDFIPEKWPQIEEESIDDLGDQKR